MMPGMAFRGASQMVQNNAVVGLVFLIFFRRDFSRDEDFEAKLKVEVCVLLTSCLFTYLLHNENC